MTAVYPKYNCTVDGVEITQGNMVYQVHQGGSPGAYTYCVSHWAGEGQTQLQESLNSSGSATITYQLVYGPDI